MPNEAQSFDAFLKETVFPPVGERVAERGRDSLLNITRFRSAGIEGWLKVETARALGNLVTNFQNDGPDLKLAEDRFIELKGATDCNPRWILSGLKYTEDYRKLACLFLGSDKDISYRMRQLELRSKMIGHQRFVAGSAEWIIGLIVRLDHM